MWSCTRNVSYYFLINGSLRGKIKAMRGVRQLSPFLFLLVVVVLSRIVTKGVQGQAVEPFDVGG